MSLPEIHSEIDRCTVCAKIITPFKKPLGLQRGTSNSIIIIGQGPGNEELKQSKAFAGQSGTRLDEWLMRSGAAPSDPRHEVYLTSVIKCICPNDRYFGIMAKRCRRLLNKQMMAIKPQLLISLGKKAYMELNFMDLPYNEALCHKFETRDYILIPRLGFHFTFIPWPHPSGLNRWHNDTKNSKLLMDSFEYLRPFLQIGESSE